ncbi:hypothetical protein PWT90_10485 [Aphanocladium album]|nr:hypothetical protein PWT90_10485 [Aphanocladium album]
MAAVTRQPFAPLDGARLQTLTSVKNRQNAVTPPTVGKRKADSTDLDNFENVDPACFTKRAKGSEKVSPGQSLPKPSSFVLKTAPSAASLPDVLSLSSPTKPVSARRTLEPKSPFAKLNTAAIPKSSPIVAPAGRSPTLGKRAGLLSSRRRTAGSISRVDPPSFSLGSTKSAKSSPWSLDAVLKGTITKPAARRNKGKARMSLGLEIGSKAGWFFDIHEDTPEQEMTNLLQHSTCVLDISSDEETEAKADRDRASGCNKENVPPPGDVSQQPLPRSRSGSPTAMDADRVALATLNARDFYASGLDETSVVLVDEDEETEIEDNSVLADWEFAPRLSNSSLDLESETLDELVAKTTEGSAKAAVLQPIDGVEESFELWESGSAKDEAEATV